MKAREEIQYICGRSSLGCVLVAESARGLCAVFLGDSAKELKKDLLERFPYAQLIEGSSSVNKQLSKVITCIEDPSSHPLEIPLDERGTDFQKQVWKALRKIPFGTTATYTSIATKIGLPKAARAVALACAANPISIITPCHRVVRSDGSLSGYRWGIQRKKALLQLEGAVT